MTILWGPTAPQRVVVANPTRMFVAQLNVGPFPVSTDLGRRVTPGLVGNAELTVAVTAPAPQDVIAANTAGMSISGTEV